MVKLRGSFVLRQIMGEHIAIPVGDSMLGFNGMLCVNDVGEVIFRALQAEKNRDEILDELLTVFDVSPEEAEKDLDDFLYRLKEAGFLE